MGGNTRNGWHQWRRGPAERASCVGLRRQNAQGVEGPRWGGFALRISQVQCLHTLRGHRSSVLCVTALPRDRIVSGSRDKTLKVWDVKHGLCLQTLRGHTGWVNCVGLLPDGRIVSGSRDKTLKVWGFIKSRADLWAQAVLSPEPAGGVMVAFFVGLGASSRGAARRRDRCVAALFKYVQAEGEAVPGGFDLLCGLPGRQLAATACDCLDTARDADVDGHLRGRSGRSGRAPSYQIRSPPTVRCFFSVGSAVPQLGGAGRKAMRYTPSSVSSTAPSPSGSCAATSCSAHHSG